MKSRQKHLANLTYRLHDARAKLQPSLELRRHFLTKAFHAQIRAEKENIQSHLDRLQPGVRKLFLVRRLEQLNK